MEQRIIRLGVRGDYVLGAGVEIGAVGSHDEVLLELDFRDSPVWHGLTKKAIFYDAVGQNPTTILLTTNLLAEGQTEVYCIPVPYAAKTVAGDCTLTIEGALIEGKAEKIRIVTGEAPFQVLPSRRYLTDPAPVTPTQAEQLQAEIDEIKEDIVEAAENAAATAQSEANAKASENAAKSSENAALKSQQAAAASAGAALASQSSAGASASTAGRYAASAEAQANRAQAEAERASVPAVEGVYNIILQDRTTDAKYAVIAENGVLTLLAVSTGVVSQNVNVIDPDTGKVYLLYASGGNLAIEEV